MCHFAQHHNVLARNVALAATTMVPTAFRGNALWSSHLGSRLCVSTNFVCSSGSLGLRVRICLSVEHCTTAPAQLRMARTIGALRRSALRGGAAAIIANRRCVRRLRLALPMPRAASALASGERRKAERGRRIDDENSSLRRTAAMDERRRRMGAYSQRGQTGFARHANNAQTLARPSRSSSPSVRAAGFVMERSIALQPAVYLVLLRSTALRLLSYGLANRVWTRSRVSSTA
jgi:hypothetical protein